MKILAIETSCDETGIAILEARTVGSKLSTVTVRANLILSQAKLHAEYGGVFPALARREHAKAIVPLVVQALKNAELAHETKTPHTLTTKELRTLEKIMHKEPELLAELSKAFTMLKIPKIDAIAVTSGPGLEPALWVGINTAQALGMLWGVPVIPVNHMEGHIVAALLVEKSKVKSQRNTTYGLFSIRPLHSSSPAGTRSSCSCPATVRTSSSGKRAMMPSAKRSTRSRACSVSHTRVGPRSQNLQNKRGTTRT